MRPNVKPKELESQNPDIDKKYINHAIEDTRAYAIYVGVDTSKWSDFYCYIFNFHKIGVFQNYDFYAVYVDDDKAYLLYSKYEEFRPVYKLLMNINKKDNTCVYDYFKTRIEKKNITNIKDGDYIEHYRLETELSMQSSYLIGSINKGLAIEDVSYNFFYAYTFPKEKDIKEKEGKFFSMNWPDFVLKYGKRIYDNALLADAKHCTEEELRSYITHTANLMGLDDECIEKSVEANMNASYVDGNYLYENDEESISHHLEYKKHQKQKRRELVSVLKALKEKTN